MNIAMVCRLIWKDWYLNKAGILASLIAGVATLALVAAMHASQLVLILGMIVVVTILIGMGAMVMMSASSERRQLTLPFVMSLPISYWEYTLSKIVGGMLIFFALWVPLIAASVATILLTPGIPHGMIPFVLIMAVEILMSTCLITAVAVTTESHGWTIAVAQVGSISLNAIGWSIIRLPEIGGSMRSATVRWTGTATTLLMAELALIVLMLAVTFFVQARKRDFL
jgi:ABC-2 type transport system permease protein